MATAAAQARVLPTPAHLHSSSTCPTRQLVALTAMPSAGPSSAIAQQTKTDATLSLWRTSGPTIELVWDWTPPPPPIKLDQPAAKIGAGPLAARAALLKGKAKAIVPERHVEAIAWHPSGDYLAAVVSTVQPTSPTLSIHYLQVDSGQSPVPPMHLTCSSTSTTTTTRRITHLSWQTLSIVHDKTVSLNAKSTIVKLFPLPNLPKDPTQLPGANVSTGMGSNQLGGGNRPGASSALFGAKNAMLQKEREKDAGRPINLQASATTSWSNLLPMKQTQTTDVEVSKLDSLLIVGDSEGNVHLYLDGTVHVSSINIGIESKVVSATVINSSNNKSSPQLVICFIQNSTTFKSQTIDINLPTTMSQFVQQTDLLGQLMKHAMDGLQEARTLWDESRRLSKGWLSRISDLSSSHAVTQPPTTQLLWLLTTGKPSQSLSDFLTSKMNERSLDKWINTTEQTLSKLRKSTLMSIEPAIERIIIILDEIKAWNLYKEKFLIFKIQPNWIGKSVELSKQIFRLADQLESLVIEEERCFHEFVAWIKYELERIAMQDVSDKTPSANFRTIPVSHYIRKCLTTSTIIPLLEFGLSTVSLDSNHELKQAQAWLDSIEIDNETFEPIDDPIDWNEHLEKLLKKMKQELQGQIDVSNIEKQIKRRQQQEQKQINSSNFLKIPIPFSNDSKDKTTTFNLDSMNDFGMKEFESIETNETQTSEEAEFNFLSTRMRPISTLPTPTSLPVLMHLLARTLSHNLDQCIKTVGRERIQPLGNPSSIGSTTNDDVIVRSRVVYTTVERDQPRQVHFAWIDQSLLWIVRQTITHQNGFNKVVVERAAMKLCLTHDELVEMSLFDFYNDEQIVAVVKGTYSDSDLVNVEVQPNLVVSNQKELDRNYPPESMSVNEEVQSVTLLSSEGRRLEVITFDDNMTSQQQGDDDDDLVDECLTTPRRTKLNRKEEVGMRVNESTVLVGSQVVLVPYRPCHVPKYHEWMQDDQVLAATASERLTLEQEYDMQASWRMDNDKMTFIVVQRDHTIDITDQHFLTRHHDPELMIGDVNLFISTNDDDDDEGHDDDDANDSKTTPQKQTEQQHRQAEIEIMIANKRNRRKGYATESLKIFLTYSSNVLQFKPRQFFVKIGSTNLESIQLFETLGFVKGKYVKVFDEQQMDWKGHDDEGWGWNVNYTQLYDQAEPVQAN
ncbi:hypothetical protein OIO90_000809 [Microbotryomycetes sp. JL221]|nr:hypothetical protein OIO90_000809 [Microbotryomycetes sp. JL221]